MSRKEHLSVSIPTPDDFPVAWAKSEDAQRTWHHEQTHCPEPVSCLAHDFWECIFEGLCGAKEHYNSPFRLDIRRINTYVYFSERSVVGPDEEEAAKERAKQARLAVAPTLEALWDNEFLPEIQSYISRWDAFDFDSASTAELLQHIEQSWVWLRHLWLLHFRLPMGDARSLFNDLYKELFEEDGEESDEIADPFALLPLTQGLPCKTTDMGRAMWALAQDLAPDVKSVLSTSELSEVTAALEGSEAGRQFLTKLADFLQQFGHRGNHWGVQYATWIEDPAPVFEILRGYLADPDSDPTKRFEIQATEREQAVEDIRQRLQGFPAPVRDQFENLLALAQYSAVLREDHNFWIDFSCTSRVRRLMLVAGRHLVTAGVIDSAADVMHLHLAEIQQSLLNATCADRRLDVVARCSEVEHFARIPPPEQLGIEPPPPEKEDEKPAETPVPGLLRGQPGSPGLVRGRARIVETPSSLHDLKAGETLIAMSTAPSFTPFFATAGGIITESGGLLSHCTVVAREYRIPAVVGLSDARQQIADGQWIEVDGSAGTVRLIDEADEQPRR